MEGEDKGSFTGEVSEKNDLGAFEDLRARDVLVRLKLPLLEVGHSIDDEPRDTPSKIDNFVEQKAHQAGGNDGVADPDVVGCP